jgi:hypothetical protein
VKISRFASVTPVMTRLIRFSEKERIDILMMVGYDDKLRSHEEACALFNKVHFEIPSTARSTVSRIVAKFNETGRVRDIPRSGRLGISDDTNKRYFFAIIRRPTQVQQKWLYKQC